MKASTKFLTSGDIETCLFARSDSNCKVSFFRDSARLLRVRAFVVGGGSSICISYSEAIAAGVAGATMSKRDLWFEVLV